jgi:hypothetical protein
MVLKQLGGQGTAMHFDPVDEYQANVSFRDATTTQRGIHALFCNVKNLVARHYDCSRIIFIGLLVLPLLVS